MKTIQRKHVAMAAAFTLVCGAVAAHAEPATCATTTLSGTYVFSASGWSAVTGTWQPKAIIEVIRFNGDGTLTVPAATVANPAGNGAIIHVPPGGTGTYALDEGCTGTLNFTNGPTFNLVVAPKGAELWMIQTNPNNAMQGLAKRVAQ
jgi:hypothetical protein